MEVYEEYKHIITQKGNTVTINRTERLPGRSVEYISSIKRNRFLFNIDHGFEIR